MKYAIIEDGKVINIAKADAPLADNWIEAGAAKIGDLWDGQSFTSAPKPLRYTTSKEARKAMVKWVDDLTSSIMDRYPKAIQARWPIEEAAARAVKANNATPEELALITNEGAAKGRTPEEHADAVIFNADRFRAIANQINTLFLSVDKAIASVTDETQYDIILDQAKDQATPLAESYGLSL